VAPDHDYRAAQAMRVGEGARIHARNLTEA